MDGVRRLAGAVIGRKVAPRRIVVLVSRLRCCCGWMQHGHWSSSSSSSSSRSHGLVEVATYLRLYVGISTDKVRGGGDIRAGRLLVEDLIVCALVLQEDEADHELLVLAASLPRSESQPVSSPDRYSGPSSSKTGLHTAVLVFIGAQVGRLRIWVRGMLVAGC
ncbi:hypothetical protein PR001_g19725 [Phytophthora rubi]|nr:hypothetical protein PR001_g19725 [Phytophthora rubi]